MKWPCPSDRPDLIARAREIVEASFAPATDEDLNRALYNMRRMTVGREGEFQDEASGLQEIDTWMTYLREYPADVAVSVIQDWPKVCKWRPAWFDIQERLEQAVSQRRVMLHVLIGYQAEGRSQDLRLNAKSEEPEDRARTVNEILSGLIKDCGMGPFRATQTPEDLRSGRTKPLDPEKERREAEEHLATLERGNVPSFHLSEAARKIFEKER